MRLLVDAREGTGLGWEWLEGAGSDICGDAGRIGGDLWADGRGE